MRSKENDAKALNRHATPFKVKLVCRRGMI